MSFKPDVTADSEERHKASPSIEPVQQRQVDCEVENSESIEMTQCKQPITVKVQKGTAASLYVLSCRSSWLVIELRSLYACQC